MGVYRNRGNSSTCIRYNITMKQVRFTKEGYEKLQNEYKDLQNLRPLAVEDLKKAREMGDLSENGYYKAARSKLSFIDASLRRISISLKLATVVTAGGENSVNIGSIVTLTNQKEQVTYNIVGDLESNPSKGKISLLSPIGKAIAGKRVGDEVVISIPAGYITYSITKVS